MRRIQFTAKANRGENRQAGGPLIKVDGTALYELRRELGVTQKQFGQRLGVTANYAGLMERGKMPISERVKQRYHEIRRVIDDSKRRRSDPRHAALIAKLDL